MVEFFKKSTGKMIIYKVLKIINDNKYSSSLAKGFWFTPLPIMMNAECAKNP